MGIALWVATGAAAFLVARIIPILRHAQWWPELVAAMVTAVAAGLTATALDFGGWNELDWRAGTFAFLCALAMVAVIRLMAVRSRESAAPPQPAPAPRRGRADR